MRDYQTVFGPNFTLSEAKAAFFKLINYEFYEEGARAYHASRAPRRIISAPSRSGKSFTASREMAFWALPAFDWEKKKPLNIEPHMPKNLWLVGVDYSTMREFSLLHELFVDHKDQFPIPYKIEHATNAPKQGDMQLILRWEGTDPQGRPVRTIITGKSANPGNEKKLQGEEVYHCIMSEAAEHSEYVYDRYLDTRCSIIDMPTTPRASARWLYDLIEDGKVDPSLGVEHFQLTVKANPLYDLKRFKRAKARAALQTAPGLEHTYTPFAQEFLGLWVDAPDQVLPVRDIEVDGKPSHVIQYLPDSWHYGWTYISLDWGFSDAAVALWWQVLPSQYGRQQRGECLIFSEIYESRLNPARFAEKIINRCYELGVTPDFIVADPKKPELTDLLRPYNIAIRNVNAEFQKKRSYGAGMLVDMLEIDPMTGLPNLRLLGPKNPYGPIWGCPATIKEWLRLRRKKDWTGDEWAQSCFVGPSHAFDAARAGASVRPRGRLIPGTNRLKEFEDGVKQIRRRRLADERSYYDPFARPTTGLR